MSATTTDTPPARPLAAFDSLLATDKRCEVLPMVRATLGNLGKSCTCLFDSYTFLRGVVCYG